MVQDYWCSMCSVTPEASRTQTGVRYPNQYSSPSSQPTQGSTQAVPYPTMSLDSEHGTCFTGTHGSLTQTP
ncbi:hypothetical protein ID866_12735 [Astraeus odoratus]|nr:hypothetical protein ID866_12735 [Astraeus odoratus]